MGLITERSGAADGYEAVAVPTAPDEPAGRGGARLRRRSVLATRRSVLHLHCDPGTFVPEDLARWYTERGFHFSVADLRPPDQVERLGGQRRRRPGRAECFAGLDAACRQLRDDEGIDMIIVSAEAADALTAALWCAARRDDGLADALVLTSPEFGRGLRRGLEIACPVLVLSPSDGPRARRGPVRLGPHVTWLRLGDGLDGPGPTDGAESGRRRFFDELGRWLGAYMYGSARDQLL